MKTILASVLLAYADCNLKDESEGYRLRNLNFRAASPVSKTDAIKIARQAIPQGYNEFKADALALLPDNAQVTFAREGSVCIYVKGNVQIDGLKEDEMDFNPDTNETRIWWD